jgi:hypothetical protein
LVGRRERVAYRRGGIGGRIHGSIR